MPLNIKTISFHAAKITFIELEGGVWVVPAKLLGQVLGYSSEGQKFVDRLPAWGVSKEDTLVVEGEKLAQLKKDAPEVGARVGSNSLTLLSVRGVTRALMSSRSAPAREFRSFLVQNAADILSTEDKLMLPVPPKSPKGVSPVNKKQLPLLLDLDVPPELKQSLFVLKAMAKEGIFMQDEIQTYYRRLFEATLPMPRAPAYLPLPVELRPVQTTVPKKDATQLVPVSNIQATSLAPNFSVIRSFFLTGHQKHPKFQDWISAAEIGELCGRTADQVKTFSTRYCNNLGHELANVQAKAIIIQNGGYFDGVASLVDEDKLPVFVDRHTGCMTTWYFTEDGLLVWRNFWSPTAVQVILATIKGSPTVRASKSTVSSTAKPQLPDSQVNGSLPVAAPLGDDEPVQFNNGQDLE